MEQGAHKREEEGDLTSRAQVPARVEGGAQEYHRRVRMLLWCPREHSGQFSGLREVQDGR
jgi:hypothetical protein